MNTKISKISMETRSRLSSAEENASLLRFSIKNAKEKLIQCREMHALLQSAGTIIREIGAECQEMAQRRIDNVVTKCLQAVFGKDSYRFTLVFETKRGQTEARATLIDSNGNMLNPTESVGGGVLDIAAFGLRLACLALMKPRPAQVLVLDEPFRFVSKEYRENVKQLLVELSDQLGIQIIMVTHIDTFMDMENVVRIS